MPLAALLFLIASPAWAGNTLSEIAARCPPPAAGEDILRESDFHWSYPLPEMKKRSTEMYGSPKRLGRRAYWDAKTRSLRLPYMKERGGDVEIGEALIRAVRRHIERAFELEYIDAVFFPDMGHSHLLVPQALWSGKYDHYPIERMTELMRDMLRDPRVSIFYHTAEQLKTREDDGRLSEDPRTRVRYRTRNISGPIAPDAELSVHQNPDSKANTVNEVPGTFWWGGGFNMSAQQDGCFEYSAGGQTYRFDLSLFDLE